MRADRLLRIVLILQSRRRVTVAELAAELEVSPRTVQRDMDALGAAGVPVFSERGAGGGWRLVDGYRTTLTGMTADEAMAVAVGRPARVLRDLGLDEGSRVAMLKVFAALPVLANEAAEHASRRVHVDLDPWIAGVAEDPAALRSLYGAASADLVATIGYGSRRGTFEVEPLGLVAKGMVWYLVARRQGQLRTYRVGRIRDIDVTDRAFRRPADFDLARHWQAVCENLADTFPSYVVTVRVTERGLRRLRWTASHPVTTFGTDDDGWTVVQVDVESLDEATAAVLSLGSAAVVVKPAALRNAIAREIRRMGLSAGR